jgi:hypothetical protein
MRRLLLSGQGPTAATALESLLERRRRRVVRSKAGPERSVIRRCRDDVGTRHVGPGHRAPDLDARADCVVVSSHDRSGPISWRCPFVNVYYADLLRYRAGDGQLAIINGESHTAICIHELRPQLDGGPILFKQCVPIGPDDTVAGLYERLNAIQKQALGRAVEMFLDGHAGASQHDADATYGCTRLPCDGEIDWRLPARDIDALVRALDAPFPGALFARGERVRSGARLSSQPAGTWPDPRAVVGRSRPTGGWTLAGEACSASLSATRGEGVPAAHVVTSVRPRRLERQSHIAFALSRPRATDQCRQGPSMIKGKWISSRVERADRIAHADELVGREPAEIIVYDNCARMSGQH